MKVLVQISGSYCVYTHYTHVYTYRAVFNTLNMLSPYSSVELTMLAFRPVEHLQATNSNIPARYAVFIQKIIEKLKCNGMEGTYVRGVCDHTSHPL